MNKIKKAFLHALANASLAIGGGFFVTGGVGIVTTVEIPTYVTLSAVGLILIAMYVGIEVGLAIHEEITRIDGGG